MIKPEREKNLSAALRQDTGKPGMRMLLGVVVLLAVLVLLGVSSRTRTYAAEDLDEGPEGATLLGNGLLDKATVRFHPVGHNSTLSIKDNGGGLGQNVVHLYNTGDSSRFYLVKADDQSYYIHFFGGADDYEPSNKRFDLSDNGDDKYMTVGNVVHVVKGNETAENKRWRIWQNPDGTYYVQNQYSKLYWDLQDSDYKNSNKLCQRTLADAQIWEMEVVASDNEAHPIQELKQYDSFTFGYNGNTVTGCNWMSQLPDDMVLSDVTMPGVHDAGTAHTTDMFNSSAQCQQFSIHDLLNNGIRYFDIRTGKDNESPFSLLLVHGDMTTCYYKDRSLTFYTVMNWFYDFLDANPTETVVMQIKGDNGGQDVVDWTYQYLKNNFVEKQPQRFYIGDHVPKMSECRGKIVILSRLSGYNDEDFAWKSGGQWALDVKNWEAVGEVRYEPLALTKSGDSYEVWTQDDYETIKADKWGVIEYSLYKGRKYAEVRRDEAKANGKDAWVVSYTSCTSIVFPIWWPQTAARTLNVKLKDELVKYGDSYAGQFFGVVCSDFTDQQLAYLVYRQNFNSPEKTVTLTIRGFDKNGDEPINALELTVSGSRSDPLDKTTLVSEAVQKQIIEHFSSDSGYRPHGLEEGVALLSTVPMNEIGNEAEYAEKAADLSRLYGRNTPTLYVALDRVLNRTDVSRTKYYSFYYNAPVCGTVVTASDENDWTSQTPLPGFRFSAYASNPDAPVFVSEENGLQKVYWQDAEKTGKPYNGQMTGGEKYSCYTELEAGWGYCFVNATNIMLTPYVDEISGRTSVLSNITHKHLKFAQDITAKHVLQPVEEQPATCTAEGMKAHYYCTGCGRYFSDDTATPTEVTRESLVISALGHDWGEWTTEGAQEGTEICVCSHDKTHIMTRMTEESETTHVHGLTKVEAKSATCEEAGNIEYWVCNQGEAPCGKLFSDESGTIQISEAAVVIPALGHLWGESEYYIWSADNNQVTAKSVCLHDYQHVDIETVTAVDSGTPATCTEPGIRKLKATFENTAFVPQSREVEVQPLGHDWDDGVVTKEATCTEDGVLTITCRHDPAHTITKTLNSTGHEWDTRVISDTATCTEGGSQVIEPYCLKCGMTDIKYREDSEALGHSWQPPTYTWSEDLTQVTASHTCGNDPSHVETETVNANSEVLVEPTDTEPGILLWYSDPFETEEFIIQEKQVEIPAGKPVFTSHQLILSGQIGMHFYMSIPEGMTDGTMTFTVGSRTATASGVKQNDGRYKFTCYVNSVEMAEEIQAVYVYTVNGEEKTAQDTTSVKAYLETLIKNESGSEAYLAATPLAKAIYNYGYHAQQAVPDGPNHPQMPDTYIGDEELVTSLTDYAISASLDTAVITAASYSLDLDSETAINFYLTTDAEMTKENVTVTAADGATFDYLVEKVGSRYRVRITGIGAHELGTVFTMKTGNTTIAASAMTYVQQVLANAKATDATKHAGAALYNYYQEAIAYANIAG